jgi:hypothetical protein
VTCCYARQNKFWVEGTPNGEQWEIYTVLEDSATFYGDDAVATARSGGPGGVGSQTPASAARCC